MKSAFAWLLLASCLLSAQDPAAGAPAAPRQDPEALALLERFDELRHVPRAAGLSDLEFATKLPSGHHLIIKWKAPDKIRADLVVPPDAPPEVARQLALVIPKFQEEARKHAAKFVDTQVGELLREQHRGDDVILVAKDRVRIVARADASKATFKEQTLTFDDRGLIKRTQVTAPTGVESVIEPSFKTWSGKFVYESLKTRVGASRDDTTVTFEYEVAGSVLLVKKLRLATVAPGGQREQALEFFGFKVNQGLDDKTFGDEAPAVKPG